MKWNTVTVLAMLGVVELIYAGSMGGTVVLFILYGLYKLFTENI